MQRNKGEILTRKGKLETDGDAILLTLFEVKKVKGIWSCIMVNVYTEKKLMKEIIKNIRILGWGIESFMEWKKRLLMGMEAKSKARD